MIGNDVAKLPYAGDSVWKSRSIFESPGVNLAFDYVCKDVRTIILNVIDQHGSGHWPPSISYQIFENSELFRSEPDRSAVSNGHPPHSIQHQVGNLEFVNQCVWTP